MSATIERTHAFDEARKAGREPFKVKDLSLAEFGRKEIRLAEQEMPSIIGLQVLVVIALQQLEGQLAEPAE